MSTSDWHPKGFEAYANSRYSYEDAELLAQLWNIPIAEAKQAIGHKILNGIEDLLPSKVAPDPKVPDSKVDWDAKALDAFFNSPYSYDDAERLAQLWNQPGGAYAGKKLIGAKILNDMEKILPAKIYRWPQNDPEICGKTDPFDPLNAFFNSEYTFDDADTLAQLWSISIVDAKETIGYKVHNGLEHLLPENIRRAVG